MSAAEICRNCRFSKSHGRAMLCRRFPPDAAGKWGNVHPEDWCGEWMAMRPGAGLPAEIAPPPTNPRNRRSVVKNPPAHRVEVLP